MYRKYVLRSNEFLIWNIEKTILPIIEDQQVNHVHETKYSKWLIPSNLNKLNNSNEVLIECTKTNPRVILSPQPCTKNRFNIYENTETPLFIKKLHKDMNK